MVTLPRSSPATRVLVVDDDEDFRACVRIVLEPAGFEVIEAEDGLTGLEQARRHAPSIVVLDLQMPVMDGLAFLQAKEADRRIALIPVIVLSGQQVKVGAQVVRYLRKPVTSEHLISIIRVAVGSRRSGA